MEFKTFTCGLGLNTFVPIFIVMVLVLLDVLILVILIKFKFTYIVESLVVLTAAHSAVFNWPNTNRMIDGK